MDVPLVIRQRLQELGLDQTDLAAAIQVTDSYISQLLSRKKVPPAPARTDLYDKMGAFLKFPAGELARLAEIQRQEELKKRVAEPPAPLFKECRELLLRKCGDPNGQVELRRIFAKEPCGELERLVMQKLLELVQGVARKESQNEKWLRALAQQCGRSYKPMRAAVLEFLETDVFHVSIKNCVLFLDLIVDSWRMDLKTFAMEVIPNPAFASGGPKRFEFVEPHVAGWEPGLVEFLLGETYKTNEITDEEMAFLRSLRFNERRPAALYYYRELQNLRDPLHFT